MKISLWNKIIKCVAVIAVGILGALSLFFSFVYRNNEQFKEGMPELLWLAVFYFSALIAYAILKSDDQSEDWKFSRLSIASYVINCLFYPVVLVFLILLVLNRVFKFEIFSPYFINATISVNALASAIWMALKLVKHDNLRDSDLMKLDMISTAAIFPLTVIWILFKIETIIWTFAISMTVFLVVQLVTKSIMIKRKISAEEEKQKQNNSGC